MGSPFLLEGDASVIQDFSCMPCDGYDQHVKMPELSQRVQDNDKNSGVGYLIDAG